VSREAGQEYHDKLLPLPGFLLGEGDPDPRAVAAGLTLTGYFLDRHLMQPQGRTLPEARTRLVERMRRAGGVGNMTP